MEGTCSSEPASVLQRKLAAEGRARRHAEGEQEKLRVRAEAVEKERDALRVEAAWLREALRLAEQGESVRERAGRVSESKMLPVEAVGRDGAQEAEGNYGGRQAPAPESKEEQELIALPHNQPPPTSSTSSEDEQRARHRMEEEVGAMAVGLRAVESEVRCVRGELGKRVEEVRWRSKVQIETLQRKTQAQV